ncbi:MAG TPA: glycosyltransferase [Actinomycetota bacterium]|nr:glycosyltransferase [Actinomycetota bacterium]
MEKVPGDPDHGPGGAPRPPRLVGWRRHRLLAVAVPGGLLLRPAGPSLPGGPSLLSVAVRAPGPGGLRLVCRRGGDRVTRLVHEIDVPAGESRLQHLVGLPRDATQLFLEAPAGGPPPAVGAVEVLELGPLALTSVLSARWLARQLREPSRLPEKVANLGRVLARGGIRGAVAGLVASESARQSGSVPAPAPAIPGQAPAWPPWEGARHAPPAAVTKAAFDEARRRELRSFLAGAEPLPVPRSDHPTVSIVIVLYNRADLALQCLRRVAATADLPAEVVLLDNASTDETSSLLELVDGAIVVRNHENVGFLRACNQGVERASGTHVLLLNSDAFLLPGGLRAAVETIGADPAIGVVGGPLVALDGTLQEAGSLVWGDGACRGYGRGDDPGRPEYRFRRDVDYVSGAFLLTRREVWTELGGFDAAYEPAYYEDVDYCFRAWDAGYRVVYEPLAAAVHYEYGSSGGAAAADAMRRGRRIFLERHGEALRGRPTPDASPLAVRSRGARRPVLVIDDRVPLAVMGSGSPRMAAILRGLVALDRAVTFFPGLPFPGSWEEVYAELPREVEVMLGWHRGLLGRFLRERPGLYEHVIVSRAHNMAILGDLLSRDPDLLGDAVLAYDAEAIGAMRAVTESAARGGVSPDEARRLVEAETGVAARADRVASVSAAEARAFREAGVGEVHILPHAVEPRPTSAAFRVRSAFLFVGRLSEDLSPNADGLRWFVDEVWPGIRSELGDVELLVAGRASPTLSGIARDGVRLLGAVDDLTPLYEAARVFVAPLRFAAGIPLKILEAASFGVPVVTTDLLRGQLGWTHGRELLSAPVGDAGSFRRHSVALFTDEALWSRLRRNALRRLAESATMEAFVAALDDLVRPKPGR